MSRLKLKGMGRSYTLNVVEFSANIAATISSFQVQAHQHHFPIRVDQPDLTLTVIFPTESEKVDFQNFVRSHQMNALTLNTSPPWVTLWWPERNIDNWTGYITNYNAGSQRFDVAPGVSFGVALVDSMVSKRTTISSSGATFSSVFGPQVPWGPSEMRNDRPEPSSATDESGALTPPTFPADGGGGSW